MNTSTAQKLKDLEVEAMKLLPTALQDFIDADIDEVGGDIFEEYVTLYTRYDLDNNKKDRCRNKRRAKSPIESWINHRIVRSK